MNSINKILLVLIAVMLLVQTNDGYAQMQPAKRLPPTLIKGVSLNKSADEVWKVMADPQKYSQYVKGIKNFSCEGNALGAKMKFDLDADKQREQEVSVLDLVNKVLAFYVTKSVYMEEAWVIRITVGEDDKNSFVQYEMYCSASDKKKKKQMKNLVEAEWLLLKEGLQDFFNK